MSVRQMRVCGLRPNLNGIKLVLGNLEGTEYVDLSHVGQETYCQTWNIPKATTYFETLELGYDTEGPTYLSAITNTGYKFERGTLKVTDSRAIFTYTAENPLVGLQAYEKSESISALGFIKLECFEFETN